MSNKNTLLIGLLAIVLTGLIIIFIWYRNSSTDFPASETAVQSTTMTKEEKLKLGLQEDANVKVMKRDASGAVSVYKIIRTSEKAPQ